MRYFMLSAAALFLLPFDAASAAECKTGSRVTLTVLIDGNLAKTGDGWFYEGVAARPCTVSRILGKGRAPANCGDGQILTATGTVDDLLGPTLNVQSASCK